MSRLPGSRTPGILTPVPVGNFLVNFGSMSFARTRAAYEPRADGTLQIYETNQIRKHATVANMYRFEGASTDNIVGTHGGGRGNFWLTLIDWAKVNLTNHYYDLPAGQYQLLPYGTPNGEPAQEIQATAGGDCTAIFTMTSGTSFIVCFAVYLRRRAGTSLSVPVTISIGATTKTIAAASIPTSSWLRVYVASAAALGANSTIGIKLLSATAGDSVMVACPSVIQGASAIQFPRQDLHDLYVGTLPNTDEDVLIDTGGSQLTPQMLGAGGAWAVDWIPSFDSSEGHDVSFVSVGTQSNELLWVFDQGIHGAGPNSRDGTVWIRSDPVNQTATQPVSQSQTITFSKGQLMTIAVSPTTGRISVTGATTGNGIGAANRPSDGNPCAPWTWPSGIDTQYGERKNLANSHYLDGYMSPPYPVAVF